MYRILSVFCLFFIYDVSAQAINFTDCGPGTMRALRVIPCNSDPCILNLGTKVIFEAEFVSPLDTDTLTEVIKGVVKGKELPFPEARKAPCDGYVTPGCPIKKGEKYLYKTSVEVKPFYPAIPIKVKYAMTDPSGKVVACVQMGAKIVDPNPKAKKKGRRPS